MSSATGSSSFNKREILTGAAVIFSMAMLMRIRRKKRNSKKSAAAAASLAERFAFPISVSGETKEILGIDLGDVVYMPPRLSAVSVVGLPEDSSNPIQNVCLVVDALTKLRDASPNSDLASAHEADVADLLFSEQTLLGDEEQLTAAVRTYVTQHCAFLTGEMSAEDRNGVRCQRLKDAPSSTIKLVDKSAVTKQESSVVPSATKTAHSADTVPLEFGFEVTGADLHAFIALVPEAKLVILLVVVEKKENNQKNQGGSEGGSNFISVAFPPSSQTLSSKEMSDVRDSLDIALMLRRALLLKKSAIDRLIVANNNNNHDESEHKNNSNTKNGDSTGDSKSPLTVTTVSGNSASPSNIAEDKTNTTTTTTSNNSNTNAPYVVVAHSDMKIRAVIPAEFKKATVEDVRCPSVAGGSELFLTLWPSTLEGRSEEEGDDEGETRTFCRIIYHSTMPSTWEDDKAITDPTEKEDEFKRNAMRHFMGYVSNTITFHSVDIGGRDCLWFGEEAEGVCCRTYICPNFDISGQKAQRKKKDGSQAKGMLVIRWESPAASWQRSQKALSNFLDYFQFQ